MLLCFLATALVVFLCHDLRAQQAAAPAQEVKVGVYVINLGPIEEADNWFFVDIYLWFMWRGEAEKPMEFDFVNGIPGDDFVVEDGGEDEKKYGGFYRRGYRIKGRFRQIFDLSRYPFDTQRLAVIIEDDAKDASELRYVPIEDEKMVDPATVPPGWHDVVTAWDTRNVAYLSTFGYPGTDEPDTFSRLTFEIRVKRNFLSFFLKYLFPMTIIVMCGLLVFFIESAKFDVQIALAVGSLLMGVLYYVSMSDSLPEIGYMTYSDVFFLVCYAFLAWALVETVLCEYLLVRGKDTVAKAVDSWSWRVSIPAYLIFVVLFVALNI